MVFFPSLWSGAKPKQQARGVKQANHIAYGDLYVQGTIRPGRNTHLVLQIISDLVVFHHEIIEVQVT